VKDISEGGNGYPRPKGASPLRVSLVPAYEPCAAPNRTHGPPLAFPSCAPPAQTSNLTVGTPDANGAPAKSVGFVRLGVVVGDPAPPDDSDVTITASIADVRCGLLQEGYPCVDQNAAAGRDYLGELEAVADLRVTDRFNGESVEGGSDAATLFDFPFPVTIPCSGTPDDVGGACAVDTTANAVVPGFVKDGQRAIVQLSQIRVNDGGPDGLAETADGNQKLAAQGVFIP
jgi:hypothetical protein